MKLYEFEGKTVFKQAGIAVPSGGVAGSVEEAESVAAEIGYPVVLKIQAMSGGRGKAGGVKVVKNVDELRETAPVLLNMVHRGEQVTRILVEQCIDIAQEIYVGITMDAVALKPLLMVCAEGGMEIEKIAETNPEKIISKHLDPLAPIQLYEILEMLDKAGITGKSMSAVAQIVQCLCFSYFEYDAVTAEINPLVILTNGKALAADSKFETDDSAEYRLKNKLKITRPEQGMTELERRGREKGLTYVELDGTVGLICGGAGIGMGSMDMVKALGGKAANFLDLGGNATEEKTADALRLVLSKPGLDGVFINVFGGINNCEFMGRGISRAYDELKPECPIVVKMRGHWQEEGWALLEARNIPLVKNGTTAEGVTLLMNLIKAKKEQ